VFLIEGSYTLYTMKKTASRKRRGLIGLRLGLAIFVLLTVFAIFELTALAVPTADKFGVDDASGLIGTYVTVPVNITNTSNGPILGVVFNIEYDKTVINVTGVSRGTLTSNWNFLGFNNSVTWGTRVSLTGASAYAIQNGSSGSVVLLNFRVIGGAPYKTDMNLSDIQLSDPSGNVGPAPPKNGTFYATGTLFDTGQGSYPSISGIHNGTITPNCDISVHTLYMYSCEGTGGHTEYVWIQGHGVNESALWDGYNDDYQTINFTNTFKLLEGKKYNYTIKTGSYPQIVHEHSKNVTGGEITCTQFTDANGEIYYDWIPAIMFV
jgi:hypothetical protein